MLGVRLLKITMGQLHLLVMQEHGVDRTIQRRLFILRSVAVDRHIQVALVQGPQQQLHIAMQITVFVIMAILIGTVASGAYSACAGMNSGAGTFGKTNWRVPTKNELKTLINCTNQ
jgi:hypothetical protein